MPKLIAQVGTRPKTYRYGDVRLERKGFLSVLSGYVEGFPFRQELLHRGNAVVVLPVSWERKKVVLIDNVRLLRAFAEHEKGRASVRSALVSADHPPFEVPVDALTTLELPAGMIDEGEEPVDAAVRELREETGILVPANAMEHIATYYPSVGGCTEKITAYFADIDDPVTGEAEAHGDGSEDILVWEFDFREAFDLLDAKSPRVNGASIGLMLRELRIRHLCTVPDTP